MPYASASFKYEFEGMNEVHVTGMLLIHTDYFEENS